MKQICFNDSQIIEFLGKKSCSAVFSVDDKAYNQSICETYILQRLWLKEPRRIYQCHTSEESNKRPAEDNMERSVHYERRPVTNDKI